MDDSAVHYVGKIDKTIFQCVAAEILTDEVVITEERIEHANRHDGAYDKYGNLIRSALTKPDYIIEEGRANTGLVIKKVATEEGKYLQIVLRVHVASDTDGYKNSVISFWDVGEKRVKRYLRNRKILYKSDST